MLMKRFAFISIFAFLALAVSASAQVSESATARQFWINAGGMGSVFHPDAGAHPFYISGTNHLDGVGTYVDIHFTHWIQIEGEARWLRFHQYAGEHQDNYLIGPRVPIHQFGRANVYGKALVGIGKMTFPNKYGYGTFTALAFGGGIDYKLSRKLTLRAIDVELQDWPVFLPNTSMVPYGVSVGMAYKVF
jgi:hypothetical protein